MPGEATLTIRLPREARERLEKLSEATARTKSWLAVRALEEYLETQLWQVEGIEEAIRAVDRGEVVPEAEMAAYFKRHEDRVEQTRSRRPRGNRGIRRER